MSTNDFFAPDGELRALFESDAPNRLLVARCVHEWLGERRAMRTGCVAASAAEADPGPAERYEATCTEKELERWLTPRVEWLTRLLANRPA